MTDVILNPSNGVILSEAKERFFAPHKYLFLRALRALRMTMV
jgi:hypothetical protein